MERKELVDGQRNVDVGKVREVVDPGAGCRCVCPCAASPHGPTRVNPGAAKGLGQGGGAVGAELRCDSWPFQWML